MSLRDLGELLKHGDAVLNLGQHPRPERALPRPVSNHDPAAQKTLAALEWQIHVRAGRIGGGGKG